MQEFFALSCRLLEEAARSLFSLEWRQFGNYQLEVNGVRKYQGLLLGVESEEIRLLHPIGNIPDRAKSEMVLGVKFELVRSGLKASIEGRDPSLGKWGGAVMASAFENTDPIGQVLIATRGLPTLDSRTVLALTGVPEIGDHLLSVHTLRWLGALSDEDWVAHTDPDAPHLRAAMEFVDMSAEQFLALSTTIFGILDVAYGKVTC